MKIHPTTYRSGGFLAHGVLKDLETILVNSEKFYFDNDAETACVNAGKRVLAGLSECIFAIWW